MSTTAPETHGPCSGPPVAKSLVYDLGPGSLWGDQASSPTRFHTPRRRPARARFFLIVRVFEAWALGLGTCIGRDSGLGNGGTVLKVTWVLGPRQTVRRPGRPVPKLRIPFLLRIPVLPGRARSSVCDGPELRHGRTDVVNLYIRYVVVVRVLDAQQQNPPDKPSVPPSQNPKST